MSNRPRIPKDVETEVLTLCRRRCCICYGLDHDTSEKRGQIAHLDKNPSNNSPENLAWLCLEHHDRYDSGTSQSKGLTIEEVKTYRRALWEAVSGGYCVDSRDPLIILWKRVHAFWGELNAWKRAVVLLFCGAGAFFIAAGVCMRLECFRPQVQFEVCGGKAPLRCRITNAGNFPLRNFNIKVGYTELNAGQWFISGPYSSHQDVLEKGEANSREMEMDTGGDSNRTLLVFALLTSDRTFLIFPGIKAAKLRLLFKGEKWSEPSYDLRELGENDRPRVRKQMVDFDSRFCPYLVEKIYPYGKPVQTASSTISVEPFSIEVLRTNVDVSSKGTDR